MRILIFTCDKYMWAVRPFSYLLNIHWNPPPQAVVFCNQVPSWTLPGNVGFISLGRDYAPYEWSDEVLAGLERVPDEYFIWMLEDYWLNRDVDAKAVEIAEQYLRAHQDVLRFDLTSDRQYNGAARDIGSFGHLDLVETPHSSAYQISLQAAVWNKTRLLQTIRHGISPWAFEELSPVLIPIGLRVVGSKQRPICYTNGIGMGHGEGWTEGIAKEHVLYMKEKGWIR